MNETPQGSNKTVWTGDRIREFRKRIGETQAEFAKRFRSTQFMVRWWEQGKGKPGGAAEVILDQLEGSLENNRYRVPELKPPPVTVGV